MEVYILICIINMMIDEYIKNIDIQTISNQTLAFIGDSVFDLYIRIYLSSKFTSKTGVLHTKATKYVSARSQSYIIDNITNKLTLEEIDVYKRGRNTSVGNISKNADITEYKKSTGFEALIGYIYLNNNINRLEEIIKLSIQIIEER